MSDNNEKERRPMTRSSMMLRGIAGGYLIYLAYQMRTGVFKESGVDFVILLGIIAFVAIGAFLVTNSVMAYRRKDYILSEQEEDDEDEDEGEEEEETTEEASFLDAEGSVTAAALSSGPDSPDAEASAGRQDGTDA